MIKKRARNIVIGSLITITILGIGLHSNIIKLPITVKMSSTYVTDLTDDRRLMGASHNVFVGKVVEQSGNEPSAFGQPRTQFNVDVVYNIKGALQGTVVVNQEGGYQNGILYVMNGDVMGPIDSKSDPKSNNLLQPGKTYLFSTRLIKDPWYMLSSHPNGLHLISTDANLSLGQLKSLAINNERVKQLAAAYTNEILLDADVSHNWTLNSYQSLNVTNQ